MKTTKLSFVDPFSDLRKWLSFCSDSRQLRFPSHQLCYLANPILNRKYFTATYEVCTTNFIKMAGMRSIAFLFNKNLSRTPSDTMRHEIQHLFRVFDECFKLRILLYTLYYTHLHISMMFMQCFSKRLCSVTPRVLQSSILENPYQGDTCNMNLMY